jgi:hypothetical protein
MSVDNSDKLPTGSQIIPEIVTVVPNQKIILKNLVDRMWDYTHKNISINTLKSQGYTQGIIEAVSNLYHIIYNLNSTRRKNLKNKIQEITTENIPYGTEVYSNTIAIMKALINGKLDFHKNTTYENIKNQLGMI